MRGLPLIPAVAFAVVACGDRTGLEDDRAAADGASLEDVACNPIPEGCRADPRLACQTDEQGVVCGGPGPVSYNYSITCQYFGANPGGFEYFCCPGCGM
jgi:hypothetical protein